MCISLNTSEYVTDIQGRSQTLYTTLVMASSAMGIKLGVFGFYQPHMQKQTQTKCVHDLHMPCCVSARVNLHAQTAVDAGDIRTWRTTVILTTGKTPIWAPCQDPNGAGSGISLVYLWNMCICFDICENVCTPNTCEYLCQSRSTCILSIQIPFTNRLSIQIMLCIHDAVCKGYAI